MFIAGNPSATVAVKAIHMANSAIAKASERISTGQRINSASDDPAGLMLANKLKSQIASFSKVTENLNIATSVTQLVDDSLTQIQDLLASIRTLAVSSMGGSDSETQMAANQALLDEYVDEIDSIANNAIWNGNSIMNGSTTSMTFQSGINSGDSIAISFTTMLSSSLIVSALDVATSTGTATAALAKIDTAITAVSTYQSTIGAKQNVIQAQSNVAESTVLNYATAYGAIMNADMAQETANLASSQIQRDAATAMLAQSGSMNKEIVSFLLKSVM
jgi:flagellin